MTLLREHSTHTTIAAVQTVVVLYGFLTTATVMKAGGYPDAGLWSGLPLFVRHAGVGFLLIPAIWVWATLQLEQGPGRFSRRWKVVSGLMVIGALWWLFAKSTSSASLQAL